jgi:hypothetical protein
MPETGKLLTPINTDFNAEVSKLLLWQLSWINYPRKNVLEPSM